MHRRIALAAIMIVVGITAALSMLAPALASPADLDFTVEPVTGPVGEPALIRVENVGGAGADPIRIITIEVRKPDGTTVVQDDFSNENFKVAPGFVFVTPFSDTDQAGTYTVTLTYADPMIAEVFFARGSGSVGGVARPPEVLGASLDDPHSPGPSGAVLIALVSAATVGVTTLVGGTWYWAMRRR